MKLSDRELVAIAYALNLALKRIQPDMDDRATTVLYTITIMKAMKEEFEDFANYTQISKELRELGNEGAKLFNEIRTEITKQMSDA